MQTDNVNFDKSNSSFFIEHNRYSGVYNMQRNHYHDAYEIYYLMDGERYYFIRDKSYHVTKGDLIFIDINEIHKTIDAGSSYYERILINFKSDFINNIFPGEESTKLLSFFGKNISVLRLNPGERIFVQNLLAKMVTESKSASWESAVYMKVILAELLIFLSRKAVNGRKAITEQRGRNSKKVSEIAAYISRNYSHKITLEMLSKKFYLSSYYLSRIFKEFTGFSFIEYLNNVRTREACILLRETKLSVTAVSEKVGYESITHFGRTFKSLTGLSPLKYRKQNKEYPCKRTSWLHT